MVVRRRSSAIEIKNSNSKFRRAATCGMMRAVVSACSCCCLSVTLSSPRLLSMRCARRCPDARITVAHVCPLGGQAFSVLTPILTSLFSGLTHAKRGGIRHLLGALWQVCAEARFDLTVEFCNYAGWVPVVAGIRRRVDMNLPHFWWIVPGAGRQWRKIHAVEHYFGPLKRLEHPHRGRGRYASTHRRRKGSARSGVAG